MEKTNPQITQLINNLKEKSYQEKAALWKDVAERLNRSTRRQAEVNLSKINRHSSSDDIILIPGKVLGSGEIDHKVQVAALGFSRRAAEKIVNAGGNCMEISKLMEEHPKGSDIRIIE